ncbi:AAA family ATPase [Tautonia sp. JC769]|uniref:AAA family ATPase n=1 Tax=Tautonia sp. JC769 TaxID=3232135 RepID=UPI003458F536
MTLSERVAELVRAAFPGLWVVSHEHDDAVAELAALCRDRGWSLADWDLKQGLRVLGAGPPPTDGTDPGTQGPGTLVADGSDPMTALRALARLARGEGDGAAILVLRNLHRLLGSAKLVQALDAALARGKRDRATIVILAPSVALPPELERQFVIIEHALPGRDQLEAIARAIATEPGELPAEGPGRDAVLDAAAGLTRLEAEGAVALSLVRHGRVQPETLWELKAQALTRSGLMRLHRGGAGFARLGGLDALKSFCARALRPDRPVGVRPRGVLLLGVPGTGKSAFAQALGNEVGQPTLVMEVGALMGSLVGQTEERTRQALAIADTMAPSLMFIDEIDKALSGIQSGGRSDGGVSSRLFGSLLSWLSDRDSDVFVIATCNDISALPPEFARAERWDAVFFLDLPSAREKAAIWELYIR